MVKIVFVETEVLDEDIPQLLSMEAMKNVGREIKFKKDKVTMLGQQHYQQDVE